jgi:hypothetical protein
MCIKACAAQCNLTNTSHDKISPTPCLNITWSGSIGTSDGYSCYEMLTVLVVAEKPSIAKALSELLGHVAGEEWGGKHRLPVFERDGNLLGTQCRFRITSVAGHVCSLDFTSESQSWTVDPLTLFSAKVVKKVVMGRRVSVFDSNTQHNAHAG